jgi:hypothetical protein
MVKHIVDRTICRALCGEILSYRAGPAQGAWWIEHTSVPTRHFAPKTATV